MIALAGQGKAYQLLSGSFWPGTGTLACTGDVGTPSPLSLVASKNTMIIVTIWNRCIKQAHHEIYFLLSLGGGGCAQYILGDNRGRDIVKWFSFGVATESSLVRDCLWQKRKIRLDRRPLPWALCVPAPSAIWRFWRSLL